MKKGFADGKIVPVTTPEELLDSDHGRMIEIDFALAESPEIKALICDVEKRCERKAAEQAMEAVKWTLIFLIEAKDARRAAYQLAYASGMGALIGGSAAQVARKFGMSREAFEQEGQRMLESMAMRKAPNEKKTARIYSRTNYRKPKLN